MKFNTCGKSMLSELMYLSITNLKTRDSVVCIWFDCAIIEKEKNNRIFLYNHGQIVAFIDKKQLTNEIFKSFITMKGVNVK